MSRNPVPDGDFSRLLSTLRQETDDVEKKLAKLNYFHGNFSGQQAAELLSSFKTAPEKNRVLRILETRLCRMSCAEGKEILDRVQLTQPDKLFALDRIKRTLCDHQTTEGTEYILSAFISQEEKMQALHRLSAVSSYANEELAAGGFLMYAPMGTNYGQSMPLTEHAYGSVQHQYDELHANVGTKNFHGTFSDKPKSIYVCHPSYEYGRHADPATYKYGGVPPLPPRPIDNATTGPPFDLHKIGQNDSGRDPCDIHGDPCLAANKGGPTPIGFIDQTEKVYTNCC